MAKFPQHLPVILDNLVSSLAVQLNRIQLPNPILVASGTFGYAREMSAFVQFDKLGGIIPKTVTAQPRKGNAPPRTVETSAGLLNSIGLDNDGLDAFLENTLPYLKSLGAPIIVNIAGHSAEEFVSMSEKLNDLDGIAGVELNMSCPNVSGGIDFGIDPQKTPQVVSSVRDACKHPIIAKLTPNITSVVPIAQAAADSGADAVSLVNTFQGLVVDWKKKKPVLGNGIGGLSGPAIKPLALRIVWQVHSKVDIPIIGVGGISSFDDVMDFLVCGASAVQIGTANFYNPGLSGQLVDELTNLTTAENKSIHNYVGTLNFPS